MSSTATHAPLRAVHGVRTWLAVSWLLQHALMASSSGAASWILATTLPRGSRGSVSNSKDHKSWSSWILPAWLGSFLLLLTWRARRAFKGQSYNGMDIRDVALGLLPATRCKERGKDFKCSQKLVQTFCQTLKKRDCHSAKESNYSERGKHSGGVKQTFA